MIWMKSLTKSAGQFSCTLSHLLNQWHWSNLISIFLVTSTHQDIIMSVSYFTQGGAGVEVKASIQFMWEHHIFFYVFFLANSLLLHNEGSMIFSIWSTVDLQCCVSFKCTAKWFSYTYILFQIIFHYRLLQDTEYSSLYYTVGPCYLSILYIIVCIC